MILFDSNVGFWEIDPAGIAAANHREALERYLRNHFHGRDGVEPMGDIRYENVGAIR